MTDNKDDPFDLFSRSSPYIEEKNEPTEYSVTELSNKLKSMVENSFSYVRVRGEFSRVTVAKSGHLYTSLKDDKSVLDAICWKGTLDTLSVKPEEGLEVICTGRLTTYPGRSNYQMIIESAEIAGQGALLKMLEERKKKLAAEGLFDLSRKRKLPLIPNKIGVITSPTGAVIRDIMHRLNERFPRNVLLYPVMVQGEGAAKTITEAVKKFNLIPDDSDNRPDILIIARGGGSLEDLMPFNDEELVRAVANSKIPVISAVGHETDTTLIDYAADLRAPTPTAAAEKAVPVKSELLLLINNKQSRLLSSITQHIRSKNTILSGLKRGISSPQKLLENSTQRLDYASLRLESGLKNWLEKKNYTLKNAVLRLSSVKITLNLESKMKTIEDFSQKLRALEKKIIEKRCDKLQNLSSILRSCSFERVLDRGYAVIFDANDKIVSSKSEITSQTSLKIRVKDGDVKVKTI